MLLARFYPTIGGTEGQALRLSQELRRKGYEIFVCTERYEKKLKKFEEINGVPVYRLFSWGRGRFASAIFFLSAFFFLVGQRRRFDILHVHLASSPAILGVIFGRLFHKCAIIKFAGAGKTGDIEVSRRTLIGKWKLWFLKNYGFYFVCPSQKIREEMVAYGFESSRISVIPNGVDTEKFKPIEMEGQPNLRRQLHLRPDSIFAIYVGRFEPGKGIEILLSAWASLTKDFKKNVALLLVGSGSLKERLTIQVQKSGILDQVVMTGRVDNVSEYLQASDIFVLPSLDEGLPNALLEAMSCGLATVASRIAPTEEIISPGINGVFVKRGDSLDLKEKISLLVNDRGKRQKLGQEARKTVTEKFSLEKISQEYINFYSRTMGK